MCGIIAYTGDENAAPILLEGLKRLEYRGYDSAGILTINDNDQFELKKDVGKVLEIHKRLDLLDLKGSIGIAHTRWATHGGVTQENAHPHISNNQKIAVIHNGIVENYKDLMAQTCVGRFPLFQRDRHGSCPQHDRVLDEDSRRSLCSGGA